MRDPYNPSALRNLGVTYQNLGRFGEAKEIFGRLLKVRESQLAPTEALAGAHQGIGASLLGLWGRATSEEARSQLIVEAHHEFLTTVEVQPDNFAGWVGLGIALHVMDRLDEAEGAFRRALDLNVNSPLVNERLRGVLEDKLEKRLFELGYLSKRNQPITDFSPYENRNLVEVVGKPVSETIKEERR
ncbi:MAG: tetratricopeptide repeat protein [Blastocatellia bacterium]